MKTSDANAAFIVPRAMTCSAAFRCGASNMIPSRLTSPAPGWARKAASHYASDHKGVCLIFDRALGVATLSHALRVKYARNLPVLNWIRSFHKDIGKMLLAKHPAWRYEQESRITIPFYAGHYLPFAPHALRGLIFGCRAEPQFINAVEGILSERDAAGHPPVRVYSAQTHPKKYQLVVKRR